MVIVMSDQKIENLLNLAAGSTNSEKEKSENLGVGFDPQTDTWEIIVKYTGDILALESRYPGIRIVPLLGQYAIVTIRQNQLEDFSKEETITYIEKSKQLVFAVDIHFLAHRGGYRNGIIGRTRHFAQQIIGEEGTGD